jgi:tRNA1Val (adenine37-N6)-methyltransferase
LVAYPLKSDYWQPEFYKFGSDSLQLAKFISQEINNKISTCLEVGTGSGVISIELALEHPLLKIDALEIQKEFEKYILHNIELFKCKNINLQMMSFEKFVEVCDRRYEIIFFNPPYFWKSSSRPSSDDNREICRRMEKDDFYKWLELSSQILEKAGDLFFCFRDEVLIEDIKKLREWEIVALKKYPGCWNIHLRSVFI